MKRMRAASRMAVAVGVAILLIASLGFAAQPARASMSRPTWATGDFWVWAIGGSAFSNTTTTLRFDVKGTESVLVNGTAYSCYHVGATITVVFIGTTTFPADIWFNTADLAIVKIRAVLAVSVPGLNLTGTFEISGNPPQIIMWPLTAGASWQSSTTVWTVTTNSTGAVTYNSAPLTTDFSVQSDATITVPVGTFTTTPVKETSTAGGGYTINYWSAPVGNWARISEHNSSGANEGNFNLTAYNYQGGNFFTAVLLGLPTWIWLIVVAAVVVVVVVALRRRKRPAVQAMPPAEPQEEMQP